MYLILSEERENLKEEGNGFQVEFDRAGSRFSSRVEDWVHTCPSHISNPGNTLCVFTGVAEAIWHWSGLGMATSKSEQLFYRYSLTF